MSASIVCPACEAANGLSNAFCTNCGRSLLAAAAGTPDVAPPGTPFSSAPPYAAYPSAYPYYPGPLPRLASFSNILGGMFDVWAKNFLNFFVVYFLLGLATGLINAGLSYLLFGTSQPSSGFLPGSPPSGFVVANLGLLVLYGILAFGIGLVLSTIVTGGMTEYAVRRFRGESMTLERAVRRGLQRFLSILGAGVLVGVIVFGLILLPILVILPLAFAGGGSTASVLLLVCGLAIGLIVGGILAVFMYVSLSLYAPVIMIEEAHAVDSLMRSWRMTKGHRWSLFGATVITSVLVSVVASAISVSASLLGSPVISIPLVAVANGVFGGWIVILLAVAYDLIVRAPRSFFGGPPPYVPGPPVAPPPGAPPPLQRSPPVGP